VEEAKAHPEVLAGKSIGQVADHFEEIIRGLARKPAIIGHSFGGPLTQILAARPGRRVGGDLPGTVPRCSPAAHLIAEVSLSGAGYPGQPQPRGPTDV
jgi:pimeloyl-ACP methyl ester carboxylesterase